jgi:hypothetical protein
MSIMVAIADMPKKAIVPSRQRFPGSFSKLNDQVRTEIKCLGHDVHTDIDIDIDDDMDIVARSWRPQCLIASQLPIRPPQLQTTSLPYPLASAPRFCLKSAPRFCLNSAPRVSRNSAPSFRRNSAPS